MKSVFLVVATLTLLSACTWVNPPRPGEPVGPVEHLLAQAEAQAVAGEGEQAMALIERALRLDPTEAAGWLALARLHYQNGDLNRAEQFARRALQFSGNDPQLLRESQALLERIRAEQGPG